MTAHRNLGPDIIALIHHVQLNETGWVDLALCRAIKFLLWMLDAPVTVDKIVASQSQIGLSHLSRQNVPAHLVKLCSEGGLVETSSGQYKLSEAERITVGKTVSDAEATETFVRKKVGGAAKSVDSRDPPPSDDDLWADFHAKFVVPFIHDFGARAYELLAGERQNDENADAVMNVLNGLSGPEKDVMQAMVSALLDRNSVECRTYVLRLLNSYFFQTAIRLPDSTIKKVFGPSRLKRKLRLVLDTNFLFSLLSLHENPSNEAVQLLAQTLNDLPSSVDFGLYVLHGTVLEFQRTLSNYEQQASQIRITRNIVEAGARAQVSGIIETYLKHCRDTGFTLNAKEYFAPYYEGITAVLRAKNVEILTSNEERNAQDQRIIDDAQDQLAFHKRRANGDPRRARSWEQVWHDIALWYSVSDRREGGASNLFDVGWLAVTIDNSLVAFDAHKRRYRGIPCVVHPAALAQALQLLMPSNENLDQTILSLMQLPFLGDKFDVADERATIKILAVLSRFENIDDLSVEAIGELLSDRALKAQILKDHDETKEVLLIQEALIEHQSELEVKHALELDILKSAVAQESESADQQRGRAAALAEKVEHLTDESVQREVTVQLQQFALYALIALLVDGALVGTLSILFWRWLYAHFGMVPSLAVLGLPLPATLSSLMIAAARLPLIIDNGFVRAAANIDKFFWYWYGVLIVAVVGGYFYDDWHTALSTLHMW